MTDKEALQQKLDELDEAARRGYYDTRMITHVGKTMCARDWAKETGIPEGTIRNRIYAGRSPSEILFKGRLGQ